MDNQTSMNMFKIPGIPLEYIVENFEQYCKNTVFNLQDNIDKLKSMLPSTGNPMTMRTMKLAHSMLYNRRASSLLPLLKDIAFMMSYLYEVSEEEELDDIWLYEDMVSSKEYIQDKYNITLHTAEGDSRVTFIFDNFVIKCDKTHYSSQTADECDEYFGVLMNAAITGAEPYALLPFISFMEVNEVVFQIFPKAYPYQNYYAERDWLLTQNYLRYQLLGEGICLDPDYSDIEGDNLGVYRDNLYIIDAGSIQDFIEQSGYVYKDYAIESINGR